MEHTSEMIIDNENIKAVCPIQQLPIRQRQSTNDTQFSTSVDSNTSLPSLHSFDTSLSEEEMSEEERFPDHVIEKRQEKHWLEGRPAHYYPDSEELPWHFCWIDDGMIGGCSAPVINL